MLNSRLPRFKRAPNSKPIILTERDHEIIRLVHRHRFLRSTHITALTHGSPQQVLRRLQSLYHHGYLERPREQLEYYRIGGSRHIAYGLGNKACDALRTVQNSWGKKNRHVGRIFLEHALFVSEVMIALELACRKSRTLRLVYEDMLEQTQSFRWSVNGKDGFRLSAVPDRVFALENQNGDRAIFFLEADRATMPVERKNFSQTSFLRKMLAYEATWAQSVHKARFGFARFRVLTVTTSAERVNALVNACAKLERGHGLFLFGEKNALQNPDLLFASIWRTGRNGELGRLLP
jgi:hypothetical protein